MRSALLAATVATAGCSGQDVPDAATTAPASAASPATPPAAVQPLSTAPPSPATPATPDPPAGAPSPSRPTDVTQDAATRYVPLATADPASAPPAAPVRVDYANPLAVAAGYVSTRLTYRFDDVPAYRTALTAPAFTTRAFAARSEPSSPALAQLQTAQETSTVRVGPPALADEAPHTLTTQYVTVPCTTTTTYRGGGGTAPATWTLRLLQASAGQWRVDGVLSTS